MAFEVPETMSTWDAAVAACNEAMPRYSDLTLEVCMDLALEEIRDMRYNGIWKTKPPASPREDTGV
jgi:hypothetical protein